MLGHKLEFKLPWLAFLIGVAALGIIEYSGLGKVEYLGYTIDHHISGWFWVLAIFIILKEVGKKVL